MVARSSTKAEYSAIAHFIAKLCWLKNLITKLQVCFPAQIIWTDNLSTTLAYNSVLHQQVKHIEIDLCFLHDKVFENGTQYIPIGEGVADLFTKPLSTLRFLHLKSKLKVINSLS